MSGIYGFTYRVADETVLSDAIGGLEYWSRNYGRQAHDQRFMGLSAIGCHVQHFTERFPYGGPILECDGYIAVIDALLFNRDELLHVLGLDAASLISDEELLFRVIREQGFDSLAYVNGDFAGAIYDPVTRMWTLFRDHNGVRPLYYYLHDGIFAFCSDQRGLAALPGADVSVNEMMLYRRFVSDRNLYLEETDFKWIKCVKRASILHILYTEHGFEKTESCYWRPCQKKIRLSSDDEYRRELRRLVEDAVKRRCDAIDGVLGAELSGGLDSGVIDILISRLGRELLCFSLSQDPSELPLLDGRDERKVVLAICKQERINCRFTNLEDNRAHASKPEYVPLPHVNTTSIGVGSNFLRSRGARVVFCGHTGDEGVSHRASRFELFWHKEFISYFKLYFQDLEGKTFRLIRSVRAGLIDAMHYFKQLRQKPDESFYYPTYLQREFCERMRPQYVHKDFTFQFAPERYVMEGGGRHRFDLTAYHGAFNDTQYLFPYADYRVLDFALSIPRRLYLNREQNRLIFRETFADLMPTELREVDYKQTASKMHSSHDEKQPDNEDQIFYRGMARIVSQIDWDQWGLILDRDTIEGMKPAFTKLESAKQILKVSYIKRCILIQNMQRDSKKWREFDERDKKTV